MIALLHPRLNVFLSFDEFELASSLLREFTAQWERGESSIPPDIRTKIVLETRRRPIPTKAQPVDPRKLEEPKKRTTQAIPIDLLTVSPVTGDNKE